MIAYVTVECISCKKRKKIDKDEGKRLSEMVGVPLCDDCFMPMVAISATARKPRKRKT